MLVQQCLIEMSRLDKSYLQQGSKYVRLDSGKISVKLVLAKGHRINVSEQVQTLSKAFSGRYNHSCALPVPHAALGLKDKGLKKKLIDYKRARSVICLLFSLSESFSVAVLLGTTL